MKKPSLATALASAAVLIAPAAAFQPGQQVTLTSSCNSTSSWLANSTNQPPPPSQAPAGERG